MAMINKDPKHREDVDYWRSMVDVVLGILLVVLLSMSLLTLGMMDRPLLEESAKYYQVEPSPSAAVSTGPWGSPTPSPTPSPSPTSSQSGEDGARQSERPESTEAEGNERRSTPSPTPTPTPTPSPTPLISEEEKSAVQVQVYDQDTRQPLNVKGIEFELIDASQKKLALYSYYPERTEYRRFETAKQGSFYLPERLSPGKYTLHNVTVPRDYDAAPDVKFEVVKGNDWDDPILVSAYLSPCKNTITLEMKDADTGEPVPGGLYSVVAATDERASDGKLRYHAGDVIGSVTCDETGTARTGGLYLGTFSFVQAEIPFGYARADMGKPVSVEKRPASYTVRATMQRTTVTVTVRDELTLARVAKIPFALTGKGARAVDIVSDGNGEIHLTGLEKATDYSFSMKSSVDGYRLDETAYTFSVDEDGLIDGEALHEITVDARKLRCEFSAASAIFSRPVVDHDMGLFRADGSVVEQWYSSEQSHTIEGLEPGSYVLTLDGKETHISVRDTAARQTFRARVWQSEDIIAVAACVVVLLGILLVISLLFARRRSSTKD